MGRFLENAIIIGRGLREEEEGKNRNCRNRTPDLNHLKNQKQGLIVDALRRPKTVHERFNQTESQEPP